MRHVVIQIRFSIFMILIFQTASAIMKNFSKEMVPIFIQRMF